MGDHMRLAQVVDGAVVNVIEVDGDRPEWAKDWPEAGEAGPGWIASEKGLSAPPEFADVPQTISKMQGILAVGEDLWARVLAYRDKQATWAQRVIIDSASDWHRDSENVAFFQWLFDLKSAEVDALFIAAAQIKA